VIAELHASTHDVSVAIEVVEGVEWPAGAERMQILDDNGRLVHWQAKAEIGRKRERSGSVMQPI